MSTTGMERNQMSDEPETYDATEIDENKWGALRMIGLLALIAAFAGFVYLAYMQGVRNGAVGAPPVITADAGPYKVAPQNPGGQSFANQDKIIFDRVEGTSPDESKVASASAAPSASATSNSTVRSAPALGDDLLSHKSAPLVVADGTPASTNGPVAPPAAKTTPAPMPAAPAKDHSDGIAAAIEEADIQTSPKATAPLAATRVQPLPAANSGEAKVATAEPVPTSKAAPQAPVSVAAAASAFVVQIASYTDMAQAQDAWKKFSGQFSDVVGTHAPNYQTADIPGKGTYYRLRISGFDTKDAANAFCQQLKSKNHGCIVIKG